MILLLTYQFLEKPQIIASRYKLQFVLICMVMIGVLISFSLQGYGIYSILFFTFFQLLNYWFIHCFFKDVKRSEVALTKSLSLRFVGIGLWLGILSTLVPIGIGITSAKGLNGSELYRSLAGHVYRQCNDGFLGSVIDS
ncbi:MAG: hypothetical protein AAGC64_13670 [Bacteroidota bacterium]